MTHPVDTFCAALAERQRALVAWHHSLAQRDAEALRRYLLPTPMTQSTESNALLSTFVSRVANRLQRGAATYGDTSFDKPLATTADEILQELEDVAGWAAIAWVRISKQLQHVIDSSHALGLSDGPLRPFPPAQDVGTAVEQDRRCHQNHQAEQHPADDGC